MHLYLGNRKRFIIAYLDNMKAMEMPYTAPPEEEDNHGESKDFDMTQFDRLKSSSRKELKTLKNNKKEKKEKKDKKEKKKKEKKRSSSSNSSSSSSSSGSSSSGEDRNKMEPVKQDAPAAATKQPFSRGNTMISRGIKQI